MNRYVDGFVIPIPTRNFVPYRRMAKKAVAIWKDHGALEFYECVGDNMSVECGMPFPAAIKAKRGETVLFSWIAFKSCGHVSTLYQTIEAIGAEWLPNSRYNPVRGIMDQPDIIEKYTGDFNPRTGLGGMEILVPVVRSDRRD